MPCSMTNVGLLGSPACRYRVRYGPAWRRPWLNSTSRRSDQTLVNGRGLTDVSVTITPAVVCSISNLLCDKRRTTGVGLSRPARHRTCGGVQRIAPEPLMPGPEASGRPPLRFLAVRRGHGRG